MNIKTISLGSSIRSRHTKLIVLLCILGISSLFVLTNINTSLAQTEVCSGTASQNIQIKKCKQVQVTVQEIWGTSFQLIQRCENSHTQPISGNCSFGALPNDPQACRTPAISYPGCFNVGSTGCTDLASGGSRSMSCSTTTICTLAKPTCAACDSGIKSNCAGSVPCTKAASCDPVDPVCTPAKEWRTVGGCGDNGCNPKRVPQRRNIGTCIPDLKSDRCSLSDECTVTTPPAPVCGNRVIETGEQCDDGNTRNGDGCSSTCRNEGSPPAPVCGNRVIETGEQCDDGNTRNGDGCSSTCRNEGPPPPPAAPPTIDLSSTGKKDNGCYDVEWDVTGASVGSCTATSEPPTSDWNSSTFSTPGGNGSGTVEVCDIELSTTVTLTCGGPDSSASLKLFVPFLDEVNPGATNYNFFDFLRGVFPGFVNKAFAG